MRKEFITERQGKPVVLYAGLLQEAHEEHGLVGIDTEILQFPNEQNGNVTIVRARATLEKDGKRSVYSGIGDAGPLSLARPMVPHAIRMAETRAKARALRDAINVALVALEELEGDEGQPATATQAAATQATAQPAQPNGNGAKPPPGMAEYAIRGKRYLVSAGTFRVFNQPEHFELYAAKADTLGACQGLDDLKTAWQAINGERAMIPEPIYSQLGADKDTRKLELQKGKTSNGQ